MPSLLIAYDGSDAARSAIRAVGGLFRRADALVVVAYERPMSAQRALQAGATRNEAFERCIAELAREVIERAEATAEEGTELAAEVGLSAESVIVATEGGVWPEILTTARERNSDVIVCGTRGRGGVARALLGSTSSSILRHADRPVLIVPDTELAASGPTLIAYDGSEGARAAIATAARVFAGRAAIVFHVWRSPLRDAMTGQVLPTSPVDVAEAFEEEAEGSARRLAEEGQALAQELGLDARVELAASPGGRWRAVAAAAASADACVLVAGSRGCGSVASAILGSVSASLAHNADRPTMIVRPTA